MSKDLSFLAIFVAMFSQVGCNPTHEDSGQVREERPESADAESSERETNSDFEKGQASAQVAGAALIECVRDEDNSTNEEQQFRCRMDSNDIVTNVEVDFDGHERAPVSDYDTIETDTGISISITLESSEVPSAGFRFAITVAAGGTLLSNKFEYFNLAEITTMPAAHDFGRVHRSESHEKTVAFKLTNRSMNSPAEFVFTAGPADSFRLVPGKGTCWSIMESGNEDMIHVFLQPGSCTVHVRSVFQNYETSGWASLRYLPFFNQTKVERFFPLKAKPCISSKGTKCD